MRNANVNVIASQLSCLPHDLLAQRIAFALDLLFECVAIENKGKREAEEYRTRAEENCDKDNAEIWNEDYCAAVGAETAYEHALEVFAENVLRCDIPFLLK